MSFNIWIDLRPQTLETDSGLSPSYWRSCREITDFQSDAYVVFSAALNYSFRKAKAQGFEGNGLCGLSVTKS